MSSNAQHDLGNIHPYHRKVLRSWALHQGTLLVFPRPGMPFCLNSWRTEDVQHDVLLIGSHSALCCVRSADNGSKLQSQS